MTKPEMIEAIEEEFEGVAQCIEVEGNPNLMGLYLFMVSDSNGKSGRVWIDPESGEITIPRKSELAAENIAKALE